MTRQRGRQQRDATLNDDDDYWEPVEEEEERSRQANEGRWARRVTLDVSTNQFVIKTSLAATWNGTRKGSQKGCCCYTADIVGCAHRLILLLLNL